MFPQKLAVLLLKVYIFRRIYRTRISQNCYGESRLTARSNASDKLFWPEPPPSFILLLQLAQRDHAHIRLLYTQWTRHVKKCNQKCAPLSRSKKNVKNLWFKTVSFTILQFFPRFTFTIWHLPSTLYHLCTVYVTLLSASAMFKAACVCSTRLFHGVLIQTVLVVFVMKQRCDWSKLKIFFSRENWKTKFVKLSEKKCQHINNCLEAYQLFIQSTSVLLYKRDYVLIIGNSQNRFPRSICWRGKSK